MQERKEAVPAFFIGFGVILFFIGVMFTGLAAATAAPWAGSGTMPASVAAYVNDERLFGAVLMIGGIGSSVSGTVAWYIVHGQRRSSSL